MAISPPSDIVLDVARAVDPVEIEAARTALANRTGSASASFSVGEIAASQPVRAEQPDSPDAGKYKRFEAMVLQTFIQNMLPKDAEGVYGKGLAGDMWKSQLSQQLADVMADRGGIGIARKMLADHYMDGKHVVPVGPVSTGPEKPEIDEQTRLSTSLIHEMQRRIARALSEDAADSTSNVKI